MLREVFSGRVEVNQRIYVLMVERFQIIFDVLKIQNHSMLGKRLGFNLD
jgi:hypothetical protein